MSMHRLSSYPTILLVLGLVAVLPGCGEQGGAEPAPTNSPAGAAIHTLRRLTNDYAPPEDACALFKEMLRGLRALEKDTLAHVHLENNVLLPRCLAKR